MKYEIAFVLQKMFLQIFSETEKELNHTGEMKHSVS